MSKRPSSTLSGHDAPILALRFQDGRRLLASVDSSRTVRVWNVAALVCVHIINEQAHKVHTDMLCLVFSERINGMLLFPRHSVRNFTLTQQPFFCTCSYRHSLSTSLKHYSTLTRQCRSRVSH